MLTTWQPDAHAGKHVAHAGMSTGWPNALKPNDRFWCANCNTSGLASWDHLCPRFLEECSRIESLDPEHMYKYFPNQEVWMWEQVGNEGGEGLAPWCQGGGGLNEGLDTNHMYRDRGLGQTATGRDLAQGGVDHDRITQQIGREGSMNSPQIQGAAAPIPPQTSPGNDPMTYNKCNWQKHYKDK